LADPKLRRALGLPVKIDSDHPDKKITQAEMAEAVGVACPHIRKQRLANASM
jgi:hypothetical protein